MKQESVWTEPDFTTLESILLSSLQCVETGQQTDIQPVKTPAPITLKVSRGGLSQTSGTRSNLE